MILNLKHVSESPGWLIKTQIAKPTPRVSVALGLGWGPRISHKFPDNADTVSFLTTEVGNPGCLVANFKKEFNLEPSPK